MKVLYWTDFFLPWIGGIETFSMDLIPALQERGHEVTVITSLHKNNLPAVEDLAAAFWGETAAVCPGEGV